MSVGHLRWALVGASTIAGGRLLPALRAEGQDVVSIYSASPERAATFASEHGIGRSTDDIEAAMDGVDAVYVSSRNDRRAEQVAKAVGMGRHVFCEKPIALRLADAQSMVAGAAAAGVVLAVNFHLRNAGTIRAMRTMIQEGAIGEILSARAQHALALPAGSRSWRLEQPDVGGGAILDLCVHTVDALRFVLDREVLEVCAVTRGREARPGGAEDSVVTTQRWSGDVLVSTYESFVAPFAGTALEVHGTRGSLLGRGLLSVNEPMGEVSLRDGGGAHPFARSGPGDLYRSGVRAFVGAVLGVGEPVASGTDGLRALAAALAIQQAAATARSVKVVYPVAQ